jgi:hypothetical protein
MENYVELESASVTSSRAKNPFKRSCSDWIFHQANSNPRRWPSVSLYHCMTSGGKPTILGALLESATAVDVFLVARVHQRPHTPSPKIEEEAPPLPDTTATHPRPKVSKLDSPFHPDAIGENRVENRSPKRRFCSTPASHHRGQDVLPSVTPPPCRHHLASSNRRSIATIRSKDTPSLHKIRVIDLRLDDHGLMKS